MGMTADMLHHGHMNLLNFLSLRADSHAQYEIRAYADVMIDSLKKWVPITFDAFMDYRVGGMELSAKGKKYDIFGKDGVEKVAKDYKKEFLGKIPINIDLRVAADSGKPLVEINPNHKISTIFKEMAKKIKESFL